MSFKTIDSQIMIARTADYARDASVAARKPEVEQDYRAMREKIIEAQDQTRVAKSEDSQKPEFHPNEGGGGGAGYGGGGGSEHQDDENANSPELNLLVAQSENVIDIMI